MDGWEELFNSSIMGGHEMIPVTVIFKDLGFHYPMVIIELICSSVTDPISLFPSI
jgi:hypothetical protein